MLLRSLRILSLATAGALGVLAAVPASATDQPPISLGPVGPNEAIIATFGGKRVIAYYQPDDGECSVSAVVFDVSPAGGDHDSTRVRVALHPGELFHLDAVEGEQVVLTCGPNAAMLTVLNRGDILTKAASVN